MSVDVVVVMATDKKDWQEVDPRVEWAMNIMDWGDSEPNSMFSYYAVPSFGVGLCGSAMLVRNHFYSRPPWAGAPWTLAAAVAGYFGATWWRNWKARRQQESIVHYSSQDHFLP